MDMLVLASPPQAAMLLARELPATGGGQTQFADLARAWARMPRAIKKRLDKLRAVHRLETIREKMGIVDPEEIRSEYAPAEHPLVCVDPLSQQPSLLFSAHTSHIVGLQQQESDSILSDILLRTTGPGQIYTHDWEMADLVIWNNRRVLHRVLPYDMKSARRRLWRVEALSDIQPRADERFLWRRIVPW